MYTCDTAYYDEWMVYAIAGGAWLQYQDDTQWCWACSACMLATDDLVPPDKSVEQAVKYVHGETATTDTGGDVFDIAKAAKYFNDHYAYVPSYTGGHVTEAVLQQLLIEQNTSVVLAGMIPGQEDGGHAAVIVGYYWDDNRSVYMYRVFDPNSDGGGYAIRSYENLCHDRQGPSETTLGDAKGRIWNGYVLKE